MELINESKAIKLVTNLLDYATTDFYKKELMRMHLNHYTHPTNQNETEDERENHCDVFKKLYDFFTNLKIEEELIDK